MQQKLYLLFLICLICSVSFISIEKKEQFDSKSKEVENKKPNKVDPQSFSFVSTNGFSSNIALTNLTVNGQSVTMNYENERGSKACNLLNKSDLRISGSEDILIELSYQYAYLTLDEALNGGEKQNFNKAYRIANSQIGQGCNIISFDYTMNFVSVGIIQ